MSIYKARMIVLTLFLFGAVATSAGHAAVEDDPTDARGGPTAAVTQRGDDPIAKPAPGRMFVVGRVLDPKGQPVADASVAVHARSVGPVVPSDVSRFKLTPLGDARTDRSGRFRIDAPRTSSTRHDDFVAVAMAPGFGAGWATLDPDDDQPTTEISLRPEQVIEGRLFDLQGRPVPSVRVSVSSINSDALVARASVHERSVRRRSDGVFFRRRDEHDIPGWPAPVTTDSEGRFIMRGIGQKLHAVLIARQPEFAFQTIEADTDGDSGTKTLKSTLVPPQILNVRATYADTGKPVAHAPLQVLASHGSAQMIDESQTDAEGKARINSYPADRSYSVGVWALEGEPYLAGSGRVVWPKGALEQTINVALPRGVLVHGKVTEEGSGKPIPGALVTFEIKREPNGQNRSARVYTHSDGTFHLAAEPEPGHLFVRGPDDDFVLKGVDSRIVLQCEPGGNRLYSHAYAVLDLKPGMGSQEVNLALRRGATVEGRVVGPDGQLIRDAWIFCRLIVDPSLAAARPSTAGYRGKLSNGRFEIRGFAQDVHVPVFFLEPERKLGTVVNLSAQAAASGPLTVKLEPCGAARAWLVDPDGKPVEKTVRNLVIKMIVTPGRVANNFPNPNDKNSVPAADEYDMANLDPINYGGELAPEVGGRITLPVLIPGATYRVIDYGTFVRGQTGPEVRKEFSVTPGQKRDLGDIKVAKPPR